MYKKFLSMLSLCQKAGKLASGETAAAAAIRKREAKLIILSEDATDNTKKKFSHSAFYYKVPICRIGQKQELGHAIGRGVRSVVVVCDENFKKAIEEILKAGGVLFGENKSI